MKRLIASCLLACLAATVNGAALAAAPGFSFAYIAHPFINPLKDEAVWRQALADTDEKNLAFVVVSGIKSAIEPCSDDLYEHRRSLFNQAKHGVVVSIAASDWSDCRYRNGKPAAVERLNRLRELFFADDMSFGGSRIPLIRQSANARFRDYAENARWDIDNITFATVHLPANNNRYLSAAGRNGEFEDRLVANRDWLHRIVMYARRDKHQGIVIFSDGSPLSQAAKRNGQRDGFEETRRHLATLAATFPGKILLITNRQPPLPRSAPPRIQWKDNLGDLAVAPGWISVRVSTNSARLFTINGEPENKMESRPQ